MQRFLLLFGVVKENSGTILRADVRALAVESCWVVALPEDRQQLRIRDLGGVELNFDCLGLAGRSGADLLVGRINLGAARVPDGLPRNSL